MSDFQSTINSDKLTYVSMLIAATKKALRSECQLSVLQYRLLCVIADESENWNVGQLSRQLSAGTSIVSQSLKKLGDLGLIAKEPVSSKSLRIVCTAPGREAIAKANDVAEQVQWDYFSVLPPELRSHIITGSYLTNMAQGKRIPMRDGCFFDTITVLDAFITAETTFIKYSHSMSLSATQTRVLLFLLERKQRNAGRTVTPTLLSNELFLAPSTIADNLKVLEDRVLIQTHENCSDGRSYELAITPLGEDVICQFVEAYYHAISDDLRQTSAEERARYQDAASTIVASMIAKRRRSHHKKSS